jgi:single-stranded DNA-binding protein
MSVNLVLASGIVRSLALKYATDGKPELRFTLDQEENGFHLWLPCCAFGATAERLAGDLDDGMAILITSGKLTYKKRQTKLGEQSRLEILVWAVERFSASPQSDSGTSGIRQEEIVAPGLKRKPKYPKWKPDADAQN